MIKKRWLLVGGGAALLAAWMLFYIGKPEPAPCWSEEEFITIVSDHYMDPSGKIRSYGTEENGEYLLESMGLYMEWLDKHHRTGELHKLVTVVEDEFSVQQETATFLSWKIEGDEQASVNAWIDDARMLSVLGTAHPLSEALLGTIKRYQVKDGFIMDFYDWGRQVASERVALSYGTLRLEGLPLKPMEALYAQVSARNAPFYPEFYDLRSNHFVEMETAHMVDQLLIATELEKKGISNEKFWHWLQSEWAQNGMISGRYDRLTQQGNNAESGAVYGIAAALAALKDEQALAKKWKERGFRLIAMESGHFERVHFFDLIWNAP